MAGLRYDLLEPLWISRGGEPAALGRAFKRRPFLRHVDRSPVQSSVDVG